MHLKKILSRGFSFVLGFLEMVALYEAFAIRVSMSRLPNFYYNNIKEIIK